MPENTRPETWDQLMAHVEAERDKLMACHRQLHLRLDTLTANVKSLWFTVNRIESRLAKTAVIAEAFEAQGD